MPEAELSWEDAVRWLRDQPGQADLVRACFFDDPLDAAATRFWDSGEWRATRALLPAASGKALDVGAGRGISSYALARDGWTVTALEPDPSDLVGAGAIRALAASSGLPITVVQDWGETLPFEDASFDLVMCRQVLHHARDLKDLCKQVARVVKPGGLVVATREHVITRKEDLPAFLASHPLHSLYGGEHAYLLDEYTAALTGAGLVLRKVLNPLQSDINLFPMTVEDHRTLLARKFHVPAAIIPDWMMKLVGDRLEAPGRLYSFVATRPR